MGKAEPVWQFFRFLRVCAVAGTAVSFVLVFFINDFWPLRILLSVGGLAVAALLGELLSRWADAKKPATWLVIVAVIVSQLCWQLLLWSPLLVQTRLWRLWFAALVVAATGTHLLLLQAACPQSPGRLERVTKWGTWLSGLLFFTILFHEGLLEGFSPLFFSALALPAFFSVVGSWLLWRKRRPPPTSGKVAKRSRFAWLLLSHAVFLIGGLYLGRLATIREIPLDLLPSALAGMSNEAIDLEINDDLSRLMTLVAGLDELQKNVTTFQTGLRDKLAAEKRAFFTPEEDDEIRRLFVVFLSYRSALLRTTAKYIGYESVRSPELKARCFMTCMASAATLYRAGLYFVKTYKDYPVERKKLNEPEPVWGIPAGMFDRILENSAAKRNEELCAEMAAYYRAHLDAWRRERIFPEERQRQLENCIELSLAYIAEHGANRLLTRLELMIERVKKDLKAPMYAAQSLTAEWIGDTRIIQRRPCITLEQIAELKEKLRPGDIILERRNWFLSNAFLPGFWPHAALYVGEESDLERLGILHEPEVKGRLAKFRKPAKDGHPHAVVEALSDGVVFSSLVEAVHADYVAVLRPKLSEKEIARAIVAAFTHEGKPYDFEFDFFTSDKLVCTELVYRAYQSLLRFDLVRVLGRDTLPAVEMARQFVKNRGTPEQQLDFVLFYDVVPGEARAVSADEETFCRALNRPRAFNE